MVKNETCLKQNSAKMDQGRTVCHLIINITTCLMYCFSLPNLYTFPSSYLEQLFTDIPGKN